MGVSLARSVELAVQWPLNPVTRENFHLARSVGLGASRRLAQDLCCGLSGF